MQTSLYIQLLKMSFFPFALALVDHCSMSARSIPIVYPELWHLFIHPSMHLSLPNYLPTHLSLMYFFSYRPDKTFLVISKHMYQCLIDSFTYII